MTAFDPPAPIVTSLVNAALAEDLGLLGDITSNACVDDDRHGVASFVTRDAGVLAGTALATEVYRQADPEVVVSWLFTDGDTVEAGAELGRVTGRLRSILAGERVALNFLSHCSGVASMTRRYVDAARGEVCIRDTRKTLPGLRAAQKAADELALPPHNYDLSCEAKDLCTVRGPFDTRALLLGCSATLFANFCYTASS